MAELKYYITYGNFRPEYQGQEKFTKAMEEWSEKVKEYGCKVVFWGIAYGVSETMVIVIKGTSENFLKISPPNSPYMNTRTNMIATF